MGCIVRPAHSGCLDVTVPVLSEALQAKSLRIIAYLGLLQVPQVPIVEVVRRISTLLLLLVSCADGVRAGLRLDDRVDRVFHGVHFLLARFHVHNLRHLDFAFFLGRVLFFDLALGLVFGSLLLMG